MLLLFLVEWSLFRTTVLVLIVLNSITMALASYGVVDAATFEPAPTGIATVPPYGKASSGLNLMNEYAFFLFLFLFLILTKTKYFHSFSHYRYADPFFLGCFTLELIAKIIAQGLFFDNNAYLQSGWNWIDGTVVVAGLLSLVPAIPTEIKLSILRTLRILRPLRSINSMPALRNQVRALLKAIPELIDVLVVMCFLFSIFGIVGLQLFMGKGMFLKIK